MKVAINGCKGMGSRSVDTDCILQKSFLGGMIIVAVDASEEPLEEIAKYTAGNIMKEWDRKPEVSQERLETCLKNGMLLSDKMSVTIMVLDGKSMGVAHRGSNKLYGLWEGRITDETGKSGNPQLSQIMVRKYRPVQGDAFLLATDGFWNRLAMQEILIDYIKSRNPQEWISYLCTRVGLRLEEDNDCYSAITVMIEEE